MSTAAADERSVASTSPMICPPSLPANAAFLAKPRQLLIDGGLGGGGRSGKTFEVRDPSSDQVIAHCALGNATDVDRAVAVGRRAFEEGEWAQMKAGGPGAGSAPAG